MEPHYDLRLLGSFSLKRGGADIPLYRQTQRLVAFLAIRQHAIARSTVAGSLWPLRSCDRANVALRSAVWQIERCARGLIESRGARIELGGNTHTDLARLDEAITRARSGVDDDLPTSSTFRSDVLPDWDEEWLTFERERLRQRRVHALERLCALHTSSARFGDAIDAALAAIEVDPLRESAHRALIVAFLAEGNVCEARRQFDALSRMLREELGIGPSADLSDLVERR